MGRWITLALKDDSRITVNVKRILMIGELEGDEACIILNEGAKLRPKESYEEIIHKIHLAEGGED